MGSNEHCHVRPTVCERAICRKRSIAPVSRYASGQAHHRRRCKLGVPCVPARCSPDGSRLAYALARNDPNDEQGWVAVSDGLNGTSKLVATSPAKDYFEVSAWLDAATIVLQSATPPQRVWIVRDDVASHPCSRARAAGCLRRATLFCRWREHEQSGCVKYQTAHRKSVVN